MSKPEVKRDGNKVSAPTPASVSYEFSTFHDALAAESLLLHARDAAYEAGRRDGSTVGAHPAGKPYTVMKGGSASYPVWNVFDGEGNKEAIGFECIRMENLAYRMNRAFQLGYDKGKAAQ